MGCKGGDRLFKYLQGTTTNLRAYCHSGIMGMADKVSGEDSGERVWWQRCGTTWMDTAAEDMRDSNRRYVGQQIWQNGLEERRRNGKISTGNDYQPEGLLLIRYLRREGDDGPARRFGMHLDTVYLIF